MSDPSNDWQGGGLSSPSLEGPLAEPEDRSYDEQEPEGTDEPTQHYDDLSYADDNDVDDDPLADEDDPTTDFSDDPLMDEMEDLRRPNPVDDTRAQTAAHGYPRPRSASDEDEHRNAAPSGPFDALVLTLSRYWYVPVALFLIVLAFLGYRLFSGGGEETQTAAQETPAAQEPPTQGDPAAGGTPSNTAELPVTDTGIVLTEKKQDGAYYIDAGEIDGKPLAWGGKIEDSEEGKRTTLEGPTAYEEVRSVELPDDGSVTPGNFGRAEPGQPILYVTQQRTTIGGKSYTTGVYHVFEEDQLVLEGDFRDEVVKDNPGDEPDEIVRLYEEHPAGSSAEKAYKVGFKAKSDAPVTALIGWRPPNPSGEAE
ncbi:MAG: hypothetical protein M3Q49_12220 [Actinomycetota bacterium]|nr:hypothetical protein [Actinomycetota bacterium]